MDDPDTWSIPLENVFSGFEHRVPTDEDGEEIGKEDLRHSLSMKIDCDLLRGVSLATCLSAWGRHWSSSSGTSMYQAGSRDYSLSFVVSEFATFISHDWQSSRWLKFLTLLWIFYLRSATITSLVVAVVWGSLMGLGLVPPVIWTIFIPWFVFFFVLCFWQRARGLIRSPVVVFMDKLCISQDNLELKAKGIQGLGAFLDCSKTLTILWSPQYFTRLWCVYELATYLREDKVKPVNLMPVAMSVVILLMCISGMLMIIPYQVAHHEVVSDSRYWADSARGATGTIGWANLFKVVAFVAAIASVCFPIIFYVGIGVIRNVQNLNSQLSGFSVRKSNCFCCMCDHRNPDTGQRVPCDRDAVFKMLRSWYSEKDDKEEEYLDRFDEVVRVRLSTIALQGARTAQLPFRLAMYLAFAISACELQKSVQFFILEAVDKGFEDLKSMLQALFDYLGAHFLNHLAVFLFYLWLFFELCSAGPSLMLWIPRLPAALLLSFLMILGFGCFWFTTVVVNAVVRESLPSHPSTPALVRFAWLVLCVSLWQMRRVICSSSSKTHCP